MVNIIRFAKKNSYKSILLGGSFYKLSAMEDKIKGSKESKESTNEIKEIKESTNGIFKIKRFPIEGSASSGEENTNIDSINTTKNEYYEFEYNTEKDFSPSKYKDFLKMYGGRLNSKSKFLYNEDFIFFCMLYNLSFVHDVLNDVKIKHFEGFSKIYFDSLTVFDKLIKFYKKKESVESEESEESEEPEEPKESEEPNFIGYVNKNPNKLYNKIISSKTICESDLNKCWGCIHYFFYRFSKCIFLDKIGKGGLGFVLECIEEETYKEYNEKKISTFSEPFACKFTLRDLLTKESVPYNFKHENIVKIKEAFPFYPLSYVLMPKYGWDLFKIVNYYRDYPKRRDYNFLNKISFQIFDVLKYLRGKEYFHNDIKLDNILLDSERNVILTDFSLGYNGNVKYKTSYMRCTLQYCSEHFLKKFADIKGYNRDNLLKIYNNDKSKFLKSEVFIKNFSSESVFNKLNDDKKYEFLIKNIENFGFKINFEKRDICIADLCDTRNDIKSSTDELDSIEVNGIIYPESALCRDNLYKSDHYAAALVVSLLFNGFSKKTCTIGCKYILKNNENCIFKIDYSNEKMDNKLKLMLKLIADAKFFSNPDSLKQFYEKIEKYDKV